jgi:Fe2+ transport system protein FeoA
MMPLTLASVGEDVRLVDIRGGRDLRKRLADLGFNLGMSVRVVQMDIDGPVILAVKDSRIVLGRGMAQKVMVELQ